MSDLDVAAYRRINGLPEDATREQVLASMCHWVASRKFGWTATSQRARARCLGAWLENQSPCPLRHHEISRL